MKVDDEVEDGPMPDWWIEARRRQDEEEEERRRKERERSRLRRKENPNLGKEWHLKNRTYRLQQQREYHIERKFGLTLDEYDELLLKQGGCCAICKTDIPGGKGRFHVDHDHKTGKIRGLLCLNCNRRLGVKENEEWNVLADIYLEEYGG